MSVFDTHTLFGCLSILLAAATAVVYWRSIARGVTRPHPFTFLVWTILALIAAVAQFGDHAGPGAWSSAATAVIFAVTFIWSLFSGVRNPTRGDWASLALSLAVIPFWVVTKNPALAVFLVAAIDAAGFYPTVRKSWHRPQDENMMAWFLNMLKLAASLLAMKNVSFVTIFYPASFLVLNAGFIVMCLLRRRAL